MGRLAFRTFLPAGKNCRQSCAATTSSRQGRSAMMAIWSLATDVRQRVLLNIAATASCKLALAKNATMEQMATTLTDVRTRASSTMRLIAQQRLHRRTFYGHPIVKE